MKDIKEDCEREFYKNQDYVFKCFDEIKEIINDNNKVSHVIKTDCVYINMLLFVLKNKYENNYDITFNNDNKTITFLKV